MTDWMAVVGLVCWFAMMLVVVVLFWALFPWGLL